MPMVFETGPFLQIAVLCEQVLQERDGVLSMIRVVDRIIVSAVGTDVPAQMPPYNVDLKLVVTLKAGQARSRNSLKIRPETPAGQQLPALEAPVFFEGEDRGVNIVADFGLTADLEGLYWIDVLLDDQMLTRIPLRVVYQPQRLVGT